jgi:predicted transcriptional regulator
MSGAPSLRYRSKGRIFADILRAVKEDGRAKPTHILYKANLSHDRLTKYLGMLEESQLVTRNLDGDRVDYSITEKGEQFLVEFRRMEQFADAFGLEI